MTLVIDLRIMGGASFLEVVVRRRLPVLGRWGNDTWCTGARCDVMLRVLTVPVTRGQTTEVVSMRASGGAEWTPPTPMSNASNNSGSL